MPEFSSSLLQTIAVRCTEEFLNDKVPLSQGLAKQASVHGLNSDQVHRCVEATNTVALLKIRSMAEDRTCEFPLAKYAEVMANIVAVDGAPEALSEEFDPFLGFVLGNVEKQASEQAHEFTANDLSQKELAIYMEKAAARAGAVFEELQVQSEVIRKGLMKVARDVENDELGLKKMAHVLSREEFLPLSVLVTGSPQQAVDYDTSVFNFTPRELGDVRAMQGLYKQAQATVDHMKRLGSAMEKVAEAKAMGAPKSPRIASINPFRQPSGRLENASAKLGRVAAKPIAAVASVPVGMAAHGLRSAKNAAAGSTIGRAMGASPKPAKTPMAVKLGVGAVGAAASVGVNALSYDPGVDSSTGRPRDVWKALEG